MIIVSRELFASKRCLEPAEQTTCKRLLERWSELVSERESEWGTNEWSGNEEGTKGRMNDLAWEREKNWKHLLRTWRCCSAKGNAANCANLCASAKKCCNPELWKREASTNWFDRALYPIEGMPQESKSPEIKRYGSRLGRVTGRKQRFLLKKTVLFQERVESNFGKKKTLLALGIEPRTLELLAPRSNQLSYTSEVRQAYCALLKGNWLWWIYWLYTHSTPSIQEGDVKASDGFVWL